MTTPQEPETCNICFDKYTSTVRAKVKCPFCPSASCKSCLQQYLLSSNEDPHCMACKRQWNREFLDLTFTPTFRKGPLKQHRREVLVQREMAMLPSMQMYVEATVMRDRAHNEYRKFNQAAEKLNLERMKVERAFYGSTSVEDYEKHIESLKKIMVEHTEQAFRAKMHFTIYNQHVAVLEGRLNGRHAAKQFIMKCPGQSEDGREPCRGFLSTQWKCGTCQKFFCHDCHALLGEDRNVPHECKAEDKATAALIRTDTRPCPKCGIRISKIDGCDQMWCTSCLTAFSWNTGQIVTTRIHNPHYYEYLRNTGRALPREQGDIPCGGIPDYYIFIRAVRMYRGMDNRIVEKIFNIHRSIVDMQDVRLPEYPLQRNVNDNRDVDIAYLMGSITKDDWARNLELKETRFERRREIGLILQTIIHVGAEKLTELQNAFNVPNNMEAIQAIVKELEDLRIFTNNALKVKGEQMGISVPQITGDDWRWSTTRREAMAQERERQQQTQTRVAPPPAPAPAPARAVPAPVAPLPAVIPAAAVQAAVAALTGVNNPPA